MNFLQKKLPRVHTGVCVHLTNDILLLSHWIEKRPALDDRWLVRRFCACSVVWDWRKHNIHMFADRLLFGQRMRANAVFALMRRFFIVRTTTTTCGGTYESHQRHLTFGSSFISFYTWFAFTLQLFRWSFFFFFLNENATSPICAFSIVNWMHDFGDKTWNSITVNLRAEKSCFICVRCHSNCAQLNFAF